MFIALMFYFRSATLELALRLKMADLLALRLLLGVFLSLDLFLEKMPVKREETVLVKVFFSRCS